MPSRSFSRASSTVLALSLAIASAATQIPAISAEPSSKPKTPATKPAASPSPKPAASPAPSAAKAPTPGKAASGEEGHEPGRPQFTAEEREKMTKEMETAQISLMNTYYVKGMDSLKASKVESYYRDGAVLAKKGDYKGASAMMTKSIEAAATPEEKALYKSQEMANYKISRSYVTRATCHLQLKDYKAAEADATMALKYCKDYSLPYIVRSTANEKLGDAKKAASDRAEATNLDIVPVFLQKGIEATRGMMKGTAAIINQKMAKAQAEYADRVFKDGKKGMDASKSRAALKGAFENLENGKYKEAIPGFSQAIKALDEPGEKALFKDGHSVERYKLMALENRAFCNLNLKQYLQAIPDLTLAIKMAPNSKQNYINRGKAYDLLGRKKEAEADFAKAKDLPANDVDVARGSFK